MKLHALISQPGLSQASHAASPMGSPISLLALTVFSVHTVQKTKRDFNRMKRHYYFTLFRLKSQNAWQRFLGK